MTLRISRSRRFVDSTFALCIGLPAVAVSSAVAGGIATAIAVEGQPTPGSNGALVTQLNDPFTTTDGRVAFTGAIDNGLGGNDNFVWFDGAIVWLNSDALPVVLSGAEGTMGIGDGGEWVYSPSIDTFDGVWGDQGEILKEEDPAPGYEKQFISFCSRPQMNADGAATWISGITFPQGGGTIFRTLYVDGVVFIDAGTEVSGEIISNAGGLGFAYDFSRNGINLILKAVIDAPTTSNDVMIVNRAIAAREGDPTGSGDNWQNFGDCKINDSGDFVFSGDSNAAAATDGFVALDGAIIQREGDLIDGLGALSGNPSAVAINDLDQVAYIWGSSGGEALILRSPNVAGGVETSVLLKVGDPVDLDGDGISDGTVADFNAASTVVGPGLELPRQCRVCVNIDALDLAGGTLEAVVCVDLPAAPGLVDLNGDGIIDGADLGILLSQFGGPGIADFNCDGEVNGADLGILLAAWSA